MSICLTWFPISGLGKPQLYQKMEDFTRMWGFYLGVYLVGVILLFLVVVW